MAAFRRFRGGAAAGPQFLRTNLPDAGVEAFSPSSLRRRVYRTFSAVRDTFLSIKDVFESHRIVFSTGTTIASLATCWAGYMLRQHHQIRLDERLRSLEQAVEKRHAAEHKEIKELVSSGSVSTPACVAIAATTLTVGCVLGWRGGVWYANRKFQAEQQRLVGHLGRNKFRGLPQLLRRPFTRSRTAHPTHKAVEDPQVETLTRSCSSKAAANAS